jgi:DNA-directed RNA polymerase specialized sigma subunit
VREEPARSRASLERGVPRAGFREDLSRRPAERVEDLTQEALLGLLRAIETFNPQAGYRFGCYAELHMHEAVRRSLAEDAGRRRDLRDSAA